MSDEAILSGDGDLDELGIARISIDYIADDFTKALTIGETEFEGLHQAQGGRSWKRRPDGKWIVSVPYEGLVSDVGLQTFEVLPMRSEEPLESHHLITELKEKFGGYLDEEGKIKFPEFLPDGPGTIDPTLGLVGPGRNGQASEKNQMFGYDSFFSKTLIVQHRFTSAEFPQELFDSDDTIIDEVPADYIQTPEGRNWLINLENIRELIKIGGPTSTDIIFETSVRYLLSRPGGWPPTKFLVEDLQ